MHFNCKFKNDEKFMASAFCDECLLKLEMRNVQIRDAI